MLKTGEGKVGRRVASMPESQTSNGVNAAGSRHRYSDVNAALSALQKDPALRLTDNGRHLLGVLRALSTSEVQREALVAAVPGYQRATVAGVARACAQHLLRLAEQPERL
jgi:hypothetical protein